MNEEQAHQEAQQIAIELFMQGVCRTRARAVQDAFDAVEETTGLDLRWHRQSELLHALEADKDQAVGNDGA